MKEGTGRKAFVYSRENKKGWQLLIIGRLLCSRWSASLVFINYHNEPVAGSIIFTFS